MQRTRRMGPPNPSASAVSDVESVDWNDSPTEVPRQPSPEPASIFARHSSEAWDHIVRFYCARLERGEVDRTLEHLHRFIFSRVRKDIPEDVRQWGRSQPPTAGSAPQPAASSVQVVVSFEYTAQRLKAVRDTKDTHLRWSGLEETTVMTDEQRKEFIHWVRSEYEEEPLQQDLQTRDWNEGGNKQFREGKRKRWHRELQRRLGSKQLWEIVSCSGRFDPDWLERSLANATTDDSGAANHLEDTQRLREQSRAAKQELRYAQHVQKKRKRDNSARLRAGFAPNSPLMSLTEEAELLWNLRMGNLRRQANACVSRFGSGRLHGADGSYCDIGGNAKASKARRVLDHYTDPDCSKYLETEL